MKPNKGQCPREAVGKRVIVKLRNGKIAGKDIGWAADGKQGCRWSLDNDPYDIIAYEVIQ